MDVLISFINRILTGDDTWMLFLSKEKHMDGWMDGGKEGRKRKERERKKENGR